MLNVDCDITNREWFAPLAEVFRAHEPLTVSEFAAKYRPVTLGAHRGQWDNSLVPYLVEIMDTAGRPEVEEIVICGPPQSGKTNACLNILLHHIYRHGGNGKYCMFPTEVLAKLFVNMRLKPVLQDCTPIGSRLGDKPDVTMERIRLVDGTFIFPAWGTSAAKLSSFSADFVWADEVDKNTDLVGDESDPLTLLEDRVRTFRRRKMLKCSTPTVETGMIWQALQRCGDIREYQVICPHCGEQQTMVPDRLTWPGQFGLFDDTAKSVSGISQPDNDPELLKSLRPARYVCSGCASLWDDMDRNVAVRNGSWVSRDDISHNSRSVGFHISGFISPDISLSDIAAAIISARSGDIGMERRRDNSILGIPHIPQNAERQEDTILKLRDDRPRGIVPLDCHCLTIAVDTQQRGFWYEVRAWGWGSALESWQVREGFVEDFADLLVLASADYRDTAGGIYKIMAGIIDSGGGSGTVPQHSRTAEVYEFCRLNRLFRPVKGRRGGDPWSVNRLDYYPSRDGSKRKIPGGLNLFTINVTYFKDNLSHKLNIDPHDPGAWHLHSETGDSYARQMCAEYRDDKGHWECPKGKDNHFWDVGVYHLALTDMLQLKLKRQPVDKPAAIVPRKASFVKRGLL